MCGIVGLIARTSTGFLTEDLNLIENMSIVDTLRGKDSTGFMTIYRNRQAEVIKIGTHPFHLFRCSEWRDFRQATINRGRMIIGHNRAATKGSVTTENAHPFVENNIILVHNGTLWDHSNLTSAKVDVDSHAIAHALAENSPEEVLPEINGAFALVWYNTQTERLYATRNEERPLCIIETGQSWVISSEPMIAALPLQKINRKIANMFDIEPGTLVEFDTSGNYQKKEIQLKKGHARHTSTTTGTTTAENDRATVSTITKEVVESNNQDCCPPTTVKETVIPFPKGTQSIDNTTVDGVPKEIANLRAALAGKAKNKKVSQLCALTSKADSVEKEGGPTQKIDLNSMPSEERSAYENSRKIQVPHDSLVPGRIVIFKPIEIVEKPHGRYGFTGKLHHPKELLLDVSGFYPHFLSSGEIRQEMLGKWCVGKVFYVTNTIAGSSVFLGECQSAAICETFGQRNTPVAFWSHVLETCVCEKCGAAIHSWDREFTAVNKRAVLGQSAFAPLNTLSVICADCVQKSLTGEILNEFKAKRDRISQAISQGLKIQKEREERAIQYAKDNAQEKDANRVVALSDRESVGKESVGKNGSVIILPGSSSIQ